MIKNSFVASERVEENRIEVAENYHPKQLVSMDKSRSTTLRASYF